jgi:hypothetical protein
VFIWVKYGGLGRGFSPESLLDRLSMLERREDGMSKMCSVVGWLYVFVRVVGCRALAADGFQACVTGRAPCCSRDKTV